MKDSVEERPVQGSCRRPHTLKDGVGPSRLDDGREHGDDHSDDADRDDDDDYYDDHHHHRDDGDDDGHDVHGEAHDASWGTFGS